jgi:hypothetical protein
VKELKHLLRDTDMATVGLITFKGLEERLSKELGIAMKHTGVSSQMKMLLNDDGSLK